MMKMGRKFEDKAPIPRTNTVTGWYDVPVFTLLHVVGFETIDDEDLLLRCIDQGGHPFDLILDLRTKLGPNWRSDVTEYGKYGIYVLRKRGEDDYSIFG